MSTSQWFAPARRQFTALVLALTACLAGTVQAAPRIVYVDPNGSASADGSSEKTATSKLQNALQRAQALVAGGADEVEIWIAPGQYLGQRITFEGLPNGKSLLIRALPKATERPVFDGNGEGGAWFVMQVKEGERGNFQIFGLEITNYVTAMSLAGTRDAPTPRVVNVQIRNNVFRRIGQIAKPSGGPSSAAVRLVNARNVQIYNNNFFEIRNNERCGLLHALYIAHNSIDNVIEKNTFRDSCGDAIRFRDGSGNNRVVGNEFRDAWSKAPVTDWYCEGDKREDCTKKTPECPSFGNIVEGNRVQTATKKAAPPTVMTWGADVTQSCPIAPTRDAASKQRFTAR